MWNDTIALRQGRARGRALIPLNHEPVYDSVAAVQGAHCRLGIDSASV